MIGVDLFVARIFDHLSLAVDNVLTPKSHSEASFKGTFSNPERSPLLLALSKG